MIRRRLLVNTTFLATVALAGCVGTPTQNATLATGAVTLATVAAQNSTTAANLVNSGALICGKIDSTTGQLAAVGLTAVADAFGLAAVTNVVDKTVGTVCPSIGLVAGALPPGVDPATVSVTTAPAAKALPSVATVATTS
jgi:hypothetical protein